MELYIFHPEEHKRLYSCFNISVDEVPLEKRQHIVEGSIVLVLTTIYYDGESTFGIQCLLAGVAIAFFILCQSPLLGSILIGSLILSWGIETSRLEIMWHRRI
uniref:Uncharacterized protein n=1 Tax=Ditylenchus dipsaci TaxID=166011 RepID=A0A915EHV0_9BILA